MASEDTMTDPSSRFPSPYHLPPMHELTKQKKKTDDEGLSSSHDDALLTLYALSRVLAEKLATPTIITTTTDAAETDEKKKDADASSSAPADPPHTPSRQQKLLSSLLHVEESAMPSEVEQAAKMYLLEMQKQKLPPSQLKFEWGKTCDPEDHTGSASVLAAVATHRTCSALMQLQLLGTDETNDDDTGASTVDPAAAVAAGPQLAPLRPGALLSSLALVLHPDLQVPQHAQQHDIIPEVEQRLVKALGFANRWPGKSIVWVPWERGGEALL